MLLIKKEFLEQSILATMLEENYLIMDSQMKPEMFYGQHHRQLFMLMQQLVTEGHPVDYLTLSARFEQVETIGVSYLTELIMFANAEKFDDYAQLLREFGVSDKKVKYYSKQLKEIGRFLKLSSDLIIHSLKAIRLIHPSDLQWEKSML